MKSIIFISTFLFFLVLPSVSADLISINAGGSQQLATIPNNEIEGFFFAIPSEEEAGQTGGIDKDEFLSKTQQEFIVVIMIGLLITILIVIFEDDDEEEEKRKVYKD